MSTKMSILRQFGSENFSITTEFEHTPTTDEIIGTIGMFDDAISQAFNKVLAREDREKTALIAESVQRTATLKAQNDALDAEMAEATRGKDLVAAADPAPVDAPVTAPVETPVDAPADQQVTP